jgi:hypothetical protein
MPYEQEIGSGSPEVSGEQDVLIWKKDRGFGVSTIARCPGSVDLDVEDISAVPRLVHS